MVIYRILTFIIICLGKTRHSYLKRFHKETGFILRRDRDRINKLGHAQWLLKHQGFNLECCDCGLTHHLENWKNSEDLHCIPIRPKWYKYKRRTSYAAMMSKNSMN